MLQALEDCNLWKDFPKGLHVLVVDKDVEALKNIRAKLEEWKYTVTTLERSEDAVATLQNPENSFHVALVEATMGVGLDGFSILNARKQIPTIMTSDTENTDIMLRAFALGAVEFLQKPLSDEKLRNIWQHAVRKALSAGEKTLPESLRSVKTMIHSFVNSPSATSPEQNVRHYVEDILIVEVNEEDSFMIEGKPNLRGDVIGCEKFPAPSTPRQELAGRLNSREENLEDSSGSETMQNGKNEVEENQQREAEIISSDESASSVLEVKKEQDTSSTEIDTDLCTVLSFNYCDKMELNSSFDNFCMSMEGDLLSDIDMDSEMLADFSVHDQGGLDMNFYCLDDSEVLEKDLAEEEALLLAELSKAEKQQLMTNPHDTTASSQSSDMNVKAEEVSSNEKKSNGAEAGKLASKNSQGKRKVKVDWTPELHRRFVQAVEQLGVDKAVPSRILELMGVNCLTRHNIASHLQKYRSHRKHLLAREAEAATWNHRRQLYANPSSRTRRELTPWIAHSGNPPIQPRPSIGFPPMPPAPHAAPFRPLHVWGHPTVDHTLVHMWQKQPMTTPAPWSATDGSFWQQPSACPETWAHNAPAPGTPYFPHPLVRLPLVAPVPGVPHFIPPVLNGDYYKPEDSSVVYPANIADVPAHLKASSLHPSKETVDAAINEVLTNPWTPLPLGLKPPSLESVMTELQRQGISSVPPASA